MMHMLHSTQKTFIEKIHPFPKISENTFEVTKKLWWKNIVGSTEQKINFKFFVWCLLFETFQLYFNKKLDGSFLNYQLKLWQTLENWHSFSSSNLVCCKFKEWGIFLETKFPLGNLRNHFTHPARDEKAYYINSCTFTTSKKF